VLFMRDTLRRIFDEVDRAVERRLEESPPDYRGATDAITSALEQFAQYAESFRQIAEQQSQQPAVPQPVRDYLAGAIGTVDALNDEAQKVLEASEALGDLKLDDFRDSLGKRNAILVLGQDDMRVIDYESVWQTDPRDLRPGAADLKPRFAGEQQVTSAI